MSSAQSPSNPGGPGDGREYWDQWNREWRFHDRLDAFMQRQMDVAIRVARDAGLSRSRILGIGSGTGWLENGLLQFGEAWATDLSREAVADGQKRYPALHLICGDFLELELPGPFDLVVSADSFAQMADHEECVRRIAALLRPGGILLLMTQNPPIWRRRSRLKPMGSVPHAPLSEWPTLSRIRRLLQADFAIERVTTICPGGDSGIFWWVENERVESLFARLLGRYRWHRILETVRLGRELVIVARRRGGKQGAES